MPYDIQHEFEIFKARSILCDSVCQAIPGHYTYEHGTIKSNGITHHTRILSPKNEVMIDWDFDNNRIDFHTNRYYKAAMEVLKENSHIISLSDPELILKLTACIHRFA